MTERISLCKSTNLLDSAAAVAFQVSYCGLSCAAFAIRYQGQVYAYLNRCSHVPMEMDYQPNQFFDMTGHIAHVCHTRCDVLTANRAVPYGALSWWLDQD